MWNLAQYNYQTTTTSGGVSALLIVVYLAFIAVVLTAMWKLFVKAGQPGWKGIIPIYNTVIMFRLVGMSGWYTLLMLVPLVNIVMAVILYNKLAKCFGYGIGMTILMFLGGIGFLILGFGSAKYTAPSGVKQSTAGA